MDYVNTPSSESIKRSFPSIDSRGVYFLRYLYLLARGLLRRHSPELNVHLPSIEMNYPLSSNTIDRWGAFYSSKQPQNFSHHVSVSAFAILEYCQLLGVNYGRMLYAGCDVETMGGATLKAKGSYTIKFFYLGAEACSANSANITFLTSVETADGEVVLRQTDRFYVADVAASKQRLVSANKVCFRPYRQCKYNHQSEYKLGWGWALRFGWAFGDLNLTHILPRLPIVKRQPAYVQGLSILNLIINSCEQNTGAQIHKISIHFLRPVQEQKTLVILSDDTRVCIQVNGRLHVAGELKYRTL